jgi:1,4-dihydroxy-2-naphthoate octaprenyltransferase
MPLGDLSKNVFFGPLIWNFLIWYLSTGKLFGCFALGGWGLFFYNDNGLLNEQCL